MLIRNRRTLSSSLCIFIFLTQADAGETQDASNSTLLLDAPETLDSIFLTIDGNKVISPFSVSSALLPLKLGADGQTHRELDAHLRDFEYQRTSDDPQSAGDISTLTVVFASESLSLLPAFKEALVNARVGLEEAFDFRNYEAINDFIKNATNGLVQDLIGPTSLRKDTELVIINAVHFEASWEYPFQATYKNIPFTLLDGSVQEIPMMYQKGSNYIARVKNLDATILEVPYKSFRKVLRIYLPNSHDGLPTLLKRLRTYNTSSVPFKLSESEVTLPKFKIETQIRVTNGLDQLGLTSLTKSTANLSKISKKPLRVDEIISKSIVEVDEHGTKAGSASGVFVVPLSGFIAEDFVANRSFFFEIRDTTSSSVYFSGIFTTPDPPVAEPPSNATPIFVSRLNQPRPAPPSEVSLPPEQKTEEGEDSDAEKVEDSDGQVGEGTEDEAPWWLHTGQPEYLMPSSSLDTVNSTPRFQQPEPVFPSGIRFPYPLKDPNTLFVIDTHLRNASINVV